MAGFFVWLYVVMCGDGNSGKYATQMNSAVVNGDGGVVTAFFYQEEKFEEKLENGKEVDDKWTQKFRK